MLPGMRKTGVKIHLAQKYLWQPHKTLLLCSTMVAPESVRIRPGCLESGSCAGRERAGVTGFDDPIMGLCFAAGSRRQHRTAIAHINLRECRTLSREPRALPPQEASLLRSKWWQSYSEVRR